MDELEQFHYLLLGGSGQSIDQRRWINLSRYIVYALAWTVRGPVAKQACRLLSAQTVHATHACTAVQWNAIWAGWGSVLIERMLHVLHHTQCHQMKGHKCIIMQCSIIIRDPVYDQGGPYVIQTETNTKQRHASQWFLIILKVISREQ